LKQERISRRRVSWLRALSVILQIIHATVDKIVNPLLTI
jgi:hypothetical protein